VPGPLDLYCERVAPGLWGEPWNALSNAGFFVAAWMAWRLAKRERRDGAALMLIALMAAIGVGSMLFHTYADTRTHVLDTTPILGFQLAFLWVYCRRVISWPAWGAVLALCAFLAVGLAARRFEAPLNGSLTYSPALVVLGILGAYHALTRVAERWRLVAAAALFLVSLVFRTVDQAACAYVPQGTHFMWHLINAAVLYLCFSAWRNASIRQKLR
jgi:hypothetical protein